MNIKCYRPISGLFNVKQKNLATQEIAKQKNEVDIKHKHIEELRRRTEDFNQDVRETEEKYITQNQLIFHTD